MITLTSGTTGQPIGFVINHELALLRFLFDLSQHFGSTFFNPLSLPFTASCVHSFSALLQGAAVYFYPLLFLPRELADAIFSTQATSVCTVPTIIRRWLELFGDRSAPLFGNLKALYCFGAPMSAEEKLWTKRSLCNNLVQEYGSSVTGRISSLSGADLDIYPDTIGRALPFVTVEIVDENDRLLPPGEVGIIRVRSPAMATNIYGEATRSSGDKLKAGWAYPGDTGSVSEDGFLRLFGRTSDLIIRGGANVYPSEVERVIAELQAVRDVAVIGFTKVPEGEEIAAFIVASGDLTESALVAHCRTRLDPDKRPRRFVLVSSLPRNANGKVMRAKLRSQLEGQHLPPTHPRCPL